LGLILEFNYFCDGMGIAHDTRGSATRGGAGAGTGAEGMGGGWERKIEGPGS
jgi:hypothetical protein